MLPPNLISTTTRITHLARSGCISSARKLFDEMPQRDTVAYNAMLTAYSHSDLPHQSLSLFSSMRSSTTSPPPDHFTLSAAISSASGLRNLTTGIQLHSLALRLGLTSSLPVANSIIDLYSKCISPMDASRAFELMEQRNVVSWCSLLDGYVNSGLLREAHHLFDEMPVKNSVAWNIMIMGCSLCGEPGRSVELFKQMVVLGFKGDASTFSILLNACIELENPCFGRMIHTLILKLGWIDAIEVSNSILSFYGRSGFLCDAMRIFESMRIRSQVSWNAIIDAHMKDGNLEEALALFKGAPETNIISWTSLIAGFAKNGEGEEALSAFVQMMKNSHYQKPDNLTFGAALHACALLAVLEYGKMLHSCIIRCGFDSFVYVANCLVNMYAKCGDIEASKRVFDFIQHKDVVSWNAMILGCALHGLSSKAFEFYMEMVAASGVLPDKVTFVGLLMACSHSGLIEKGKDLFHIMESVHGVSPDTDHMTCMVDMLGRAGHLKEASKLIDGYSSEESSINSIEALLSGCSMNGDVRVGRRVGEELVRMEPKKEVGYVMLSNLYCASGQWMEAQRVRKEMVDQGVKKAPGCSWIEVRDRVVVFMSGSRSFVQSHAHKILGSLQSEMRNPSFVFLQKEFLMPVS